MIISPCGRPSSSAASAAALAGDGGCHRECARVRMEPRSNLHSGASSVLFSAYCTNKACTCASLQYSSLVSSCL